MKRRSALKNIALSSAAAWLLPSCVKDPKKVSIALNNLKVTGEEEDLLGNIADVIIPATDTPGARAVEAHLFTLIMVDDCLKKTEQKKYLKGMRSFEDEVESMTDKSFTKATPEERLVILTNVEKNLNELSEETRDFYLKSKGYIMQGFLSSKHFLTNVKKYTHIPGPVFKACTPVVTLQKTESNG